MKFKLIKYYLDTVDDQLNAFIFYHVKLKIGLFSIPFCSYLLSDKNNNINEQNSLKISKLKIDDTKIILNNKRWGLNSIWFNNYYNSISLNLYSINHKPLTWTCIFPLSDSNVNLLSHSYKGTGYVEKIELEFLPWKLPIEKLLWGRVIAENFSFIWIVWKGEYPLNKFIFNGKLIENAIISHNEISFLNYKIELTNIQTIKDEKLSKLSDKYLFLQWIFPKKFLNSIEIKYKSKANIYVDNQLNNIGNSIFETVEWRK